MVVEPSADHTTRSAPAGSEPPVLFVFSPNGTVVALLMPRYRLENAPAVPAHVQVAPPASFSLPATPPVQVQPPPGAVVGAPTMIAALADDAPTSKPSTASNATRAAVEPRRRCEVEIPPCG